MAIPTYVGKGTFSVSTAYGGGTPTDVTLSMPGVGVLADDIILLFIETPNDTRASTREILASGYTRFADPGTGTYNGTASTRLSVLWKRAAGGDGSAVGTGENYDHKMGVAVVFRGCVTSGTPYEALTTGTGASSTSVSIAGGTTLDTDRLVVASVAHHVDIATTPWLSSIANAALANLTERVNDSNDVSNGGGIAVITGEKATAGAVGSTTGTASNATVKGYVSFALIPTSAGGGATLARSQAVVIG